MMDYRDAVWYLREAAEKWLKEHPDDVLYRDNLQEALKLTDDVTIAGIRRRSS